MLFKKILQFTIYLQESPEGKKMLQARMSLPAFKEKERLLQAIAQNQVCLLGHTFFLGCNLPIKFIYHLKAICILRRFILLYA